MSDEKKIRRVELRRPSASPDTQQLYAEVEGGLDELFSMIQELQSGRSLIADSSVSAPSNGSNYLSQDTSNNLVLNVYNATLGRYQSVTLS